jgi:hypothetical protein
MKRRTAFVILAAIAVLAPAAARPSAAGGAREPRIKFQQATWDFGKIKQGDIASHEFVFTNEGDDTLKIEKVATSCGCTAALVSDREIAPGKTGKVEVKFNSQGYGGNVAKIIYVFSNDPKEAQKALDIKADVEVPPSPRIEIEPYNYDAGLLIEGDELRPNLKIINRGELELRVEFNHRNATYTIRDKPAPLPLKIASGKEVTVTVHIPTQGRAGAVREYVLLKSNDSMRSTLSMYISGYVITKEQLKELFDKHKDILR